MDALLTIAILYWICKKVFGPKKLKNKKGTRSPFDNTAQHRAQRAREIHEKLVKQRDMEQQQVMECKAVQPAEGEALPCFEGAGHTGSLHTESTEGLDLCDPSLEHDRDLPEDPQSVYAGEIGREPLLDLSARGIYQGVVMSEILKRPVLGRPRH